MKTAALLPLLLVSACPLRPPPLPGGDSCYVAPELDASASCVAPCSNGNEKMVGEFCSRGGGECDDNYGRAPGAAIICTVEFEPDTKDWFCTRPCDNDEQCGSGAACRGDPAEDGGRKGCVPASCL
ncbi:MAG: hypothetical protein HY904_12255 [Deltaproteobacteria bacterium]|nr:hypothetical protein [Deltaproteobacteria bacterium]